MLFENLFRKEAKEEKAFWKAYNKAFKSMSQKSLTALEEAMKAFPSAWQGYFLLSLYYGMCYTKDVCPNAVKAMEMQMKAENAASGTEDEEWIHSFYAWYNQDALSLFKPMDEHCKRIRQAGIAAMNMYHHNNPVVARHDYMDDAVFWSNIFDYCGAASSGCYPEKEALSQYFHDWKSFDRSEYNELVEQSNSFLKTYQKMRKRYDKIVKKLSKDWDVYWGEFTDMYAYIMGFTMLNETPYTFSSAWTEKSAPTYGIEFLVESADMGGTPAIHELFRLSRSSTENMNFIENVCRGRYMQKEVEWIKKCIDIRDQEAMSLAAKYYSQEVGEDFDE